MSDTPPTAVDTALASYRELFPVCRDHVYLNHAAVSPTSTRVRDAVCAWMARYTDRGILDEAAWEPEAASCRARAAGLIGAGADEIAIVRNTTHGLSLVAEGLDWRPGDRVAVATSVEYPSNVFAWQRLASRGVEVDEISCPTSVGAVTAEAAAAALTPKTRLLSVSTAQFGTGGVTELAAVGEMCRRRGVLLCVDGIQSVGALELDVDEIGIHFLAADSHKWMLGVLGIGFAYIQRDMQERVRPVMVGWKTVPEPFTFDGRFGLAPSALRYEEATLSQPLVVGMDAALALIEEISVARISAHVRALVERLAEGLSAIGCDVGPAPAHRRHILTFSHPACAPEALLDYLSERKIVISLRRGRLRASPHFYNTAAEIDRLVEVVAEAARAGLTG
ncbi:aminotransferase class V-fold PLP-dependent enzyme [Haliangium sp.]|uniref:aminotransferase class V-fold PLP-dependent enzyme n=1 Tax=Haliangium sp. TaxID=2663208 RepID=UPI003D133083